MYFHLYLFIIIPVTKNLKFLRYLASLEYAEALKCLPLILINELILNKNLLFLNPQKVTWRVRVGKKYKSKLE